MDTLRAGSNIKGSNTDPGLGADNPNRREAPGRRVFNFISSSLLLITSLLTFLLTFWGKQCTSYSSHSLEATSTPLSGRVRVEGHVASPCPATHSWEDGVGLCARDSVLSSQPRLAQLRCRLLQPLGGQRREPRCAGGGAGPSQELSSGPVLSPLLSEAIRHRNQPLICSTSSSNVTELLLLGGQVQWERGWSSDV